MSEIQKIITFSRRSDPAPYTDWLLRQIQNGSCTVPNPFSGKSYTVSLKPEDVSLFTFWTKNPQPLVKTAEILREKGFRSAFFITVTGYPRFLEPQVPDPEELKDAIRTLAELFTPDALWWRYDPVILSKKLSPQWHEDNFKSLCENIWDKNTSRVIFSLAHLDGPYASLRKSLSSALESQDDSLLMPKFLSQEYDQLYDTALELFSSLAKTAVAYGINAEVCCSPRLRDNETRISQGSCLSMKYIEKLVPGISSYKKGPTRRGVSMSGNGYADCGCVKSSDIGINGTCPHECVYCYANRRGLNPDGIKQLIAF
jgi:hypothetical protein